MNDYDRVAKVIRYLEAHQVAQPSLAELASASGLSESHFHRLFSRWAGVTPKDFLQCLTLEHAKSRLRQSASVLEAALDAGLSGPGRLHDLMVTLESITPGEYKNHARGVTVHWGYAESPFGLCSIGWNSRGLCHLAFHEREEPVPPELQESWPGADLNRNDPVAGTRAEAIFRPEQRHGSPLKLFVQGTAFQVQTWRALLRIPEGNVVSYRSLATLLGNAGSARAVGSACGANPIAYLIPCHRVIRETGVVQGYRWGAARKRAMLAREAAAIAVPLHDQELTNLSAVSR